VRWSAASSSCRQILARLQLVAAATPTLLVESEAGIGKSACSTKSPRFAARAACGGARPAGRPPNTLLTRASASWFRPLAHPRHLDVVVGHLLELGQLAGDLVSRFPLLAEVDELRSLAAEKLERTAASRRRTAARRLAAARLGGPFEIARFSPHPQKITAGRPFAICSKTSIWRARRRRNPRAVSPPSCQDRFCWSPPASFGVEAAARRPCCSPMARGSAHHPAAARALAGDDFARLVGLHSVHRGAAAETVDRLFAASEAIRFSCAS